MTNSYASYLGAALYNRAMAARRESTRLYFIELEIKDSIKETVSIDGNVRKYINPVSMGIILGCNCHDLYVAIENHKRHLATIDESWLDNYGNRNFKCDPRDRVYIQGWINFLSLECFSDSLEAKEAVRVLKEVA